MNQILLFYFLRNLMRRFDIMEKKYYGNILVSEQISAVRVLIRNDVWGVLSIVDRYWAEKFINEFHGVYGKLPRKIDESFCRNQMQYLKNNIDPADYYLLKGIFYDGASPMYVYMRRAAKLLSGDFLLESICLSRELDWQGRIEELPQKIAALGESMDTGSDSGLYRIACLIDLIENKPIECTPSRVCSLVEKSDLHPAISFLILSRMSFTLPPEIVCNILKVPAFQQRDQKWPANLIVGEILCRTGKYIEAIRVFEQADISGVRIDSYLKPGFFHHLAISYLRSGQKGKSLLLRLEMLKDEDLKCFYPDFWIISVVEVATYYCSQGEMEKAEGLISKLGEIVMDCIPEECLADFYLLTADINYYQGEKGNALRFYMASQQISPKKSTLTRIREIEEALSAGDNSGGKKENGFDEYEIS